MVFKAVACLTLFALIAVGYCGPVSRSKTQKLQKINCEVDQTNSSSDESGQVTLCELMNHENNKGRSQNNKKILQGQDSSSSESAEHQRTDNVAVSQEEHGWNKEIRKAPEHQRMQSQHRHNMQVIEVRENIQRSRHFNSENSSNENNFQAAKNQISRY